MINNNDAVHTEMLVKLFNFDLKVEGEYPFYTDDRILVNCGTMQKKVYRNGKRRTVNVPPVSLHTKKGLQLAEAISNQLYKQEEQKFENVEPKKQFHNQFITFVVHNWQEYLTKQQKQFLHDVLEGEEELYTKQQRYQFRINIQKRLKMAFIGVGGDNVSIYRMGEFRLKLDLIKQFLEVDEDNEQFGREIIKNLDREYISEIVYDRMSPEAQKNIVLCYQGKVPRIENKHLYEFYEIIVADKEKFEIMGLN